MAEGTKKIEKRERHASAQASYMQRKRDEGLAWVATWVPAEAKEAFKKLAQKAHKTQAKPDQARMAVLEKTLGYPIPDWARENAVLFDIWRLAQDSAPPEVPETSSEEEAKEKPKKSKKKKKKKG